MRENSEIPICITKNVESLFKKDVDFSSQYILLEEPTRAK